jgi:hypothetical protein
VVIDEPFGALGATHLIQLAIASFYDAKPERRDTSRIATLGASLAVYPDVYLFHVGGRWGDHSSLDVFPTRKEVFVGNDPQDVLEAVIDRAITWLAVPEREPHGLSYYYTDPAEYYDRMKGAFVYSPTGRVEGADIMVTGSGEPGESDPQMVLDPDGAVEYLRSNGYLETFVEPRLHSRDYAHVVVERAQEAREGLATAVVRRAAISNDGVVTETYRSVPVETALSMLGSPATSQAWVSQLSVGPAVRHGEVGRDPAAVVTATGETVATTGGSLENIQASSGRFDAGPVVLPGMRDNHCVCANQKRK